MRHKCLAAFIVFVLFFSILGVMGFGQVRLILTPKFVSNFLEKANIYNNLGNIGQQLAQSTKDVQSKETILDITNSIDPTWLKKEVNSNLPPFFNYLWGKTTNLNIVIDITPFKAKLPANFQTTVSEMLKSVPPCPTGVSTPTPTNENAPSCMDAATRANLEKLAQMPDKINLNDYVKNPDLVFDRTKLFFTVIKLGFWGGLIFSLILIGILILLGRGWWPSIPRWIGLALVLPSGAALLSDLGWKALSPSLQSQIFAGLNPQAKPIVEPIISAFMSQTFTSGIILAGSIFALGWVLIILSYALPHPPEPKPPAKAPIPPQPNPPSPAPAK